METVLPIIIIVAVITFFWAGVPVIFWSTHKSMTKENAPQYGYVGYKVFVQEFDKVEWRMDSTFKTSLFGKVDIWNARTQMHASIFMINGKGLVINNPFSYLLAVSYIRKTTKELQKKNGYGNVVKWG